MANWLDLAQVGAESGRPSALAVANEAGKRGNRDRNEMAMMASGRDLGMSDGADQAAVTLISMQQRGRGEGQSVGLPATSTSVGIGSMLAGKKAATPEPAAGKRWASLPAQGNDLALERALPEVLTASVRAIVLDRGWRLPAPATQQQALLSQSRECVDDAGNQGDCQTLDRAVQLPCDNGGHADGSPSRMPWDGVVTTARRVFIRAWRQGRAA